MLLPTFLPFEGECSRLRCYVSTITFRSAVYFHLPAARFCKETGIQPVIEPC